MEFKQAKIRWFDSLKGEGLIRLANGTCVPVHFTAFYKVEDGNYSYPAQWMQDDAERNIVRGADVDIVIQDGMVLAAFC